ncbi:MAG: hypothetical protein ACREQL_10165 [Candidatus Binatia bacterium]
MEHNIIDENRPRTIATQFELFAARLMESWIVAGHVQVSSGDLKMAADFLRQAGWSVEETAGLMVQLRGRDGHTCELTREDTILLAVRTLAGRVQP